MHLGHAAGRERLLEPVAVGQFGAREVERVIRVRDGSLLDEDSMNILAEMAVERDYQIWIERVDSSGKIGFVLEDGHLANEQREAAE